MGKIAPKCPLWKPITAKEIIQLGISGGTESEFGMWSRYVTISCCNDHRKFDSEQATRPVTN